MDIAKIIEEDNLNELIENKELDFLSIVGPNGRNLFHTACYFGSTKIVKHMLEKNPEIINSVDSSGNPGLYFAILKDKKNVFDILMKEDSLNANLIHKNKKSLAMNIVLLKERNSYLISLLKENKIDLSYSVDGKTISDIFNTEKEKEKSVESVISNAFLKELTGSTKNNSEKNQDKDEIDVSNMSQDEILKELSKLGFENLTEINKSQNHIDGREKEVEEVSRILENNQNIVITGVDGLGKTTLVNQIAQKTNKLILKIPPDLLKGNQYVNSTNEKINTWLPLFLKLKDSVLFVDDMEILSSGATEKNQNDTPLSILKNYIKQSSNKRIQIIGTINDGNYEKMIDSEEGKSFLSLFSNGTSDGFELKELSEEDTYKILISKNTINNLLKTGLKIGDEQKYEEVVRIALDLTDSFIFNQKFPFKGFDFLVQLISKNELESLTKEKIEDEFSKKYNVPIEYIKGYLPENSKYLSLEKEMKANIIGQNPVLEEIAESIANNITRSSPKDRTPLSMFFMGPTGVGKSEVANIIYKHLGYEVLNLNCSEFLGANKVTEFIDILKEHVKKNYNGIIILDEIEKGDERLGNVLLALGEGKIGSGKDMVYCGNQIIIATSNVGAKEISEDKRFIHERDIEDFNIPKEELKEILLKSEKFKRPEVLGRFSKFLAFSQIFDDVAKQIAYALVKKEVISQKENRDLNITIPHDVVDFVLLKKFNAIENEKSGARGIKNIVADLVGNIFPTIESKKLKYAGVNASLKINDSGNIVSEIVTPTGEKSEFSVMEKGQKSKEEKLKELRILQVEAIRAEEAGLLINQRSSRKSSPR